jgi:GNAT superfamily N-acetyltransferase
VCTIWHDELDEVIELAKRETDALGFLPRPSVQYYAQQGGVLSVGVAKCAPIAFLVGAYARMTTPLEAHIYQVMTAKEHRRRTYAKRLLHHFEMRCRIRHVTRITLEVRSDLKPALAFWNQMGYEIYHTKPAGKRRGGELLCHQKLLKTVLTVRNPPPSMLPEENDEPSKQRQTAAPNADRGSDWSLPTSNPHRSVEWEEDVKPDTKT